MLTTGKRVHCIGIGGAGMSALAFFLRDMGIIVSGSDVLDVSASFSHLPAAEVSVTIGHHADAVEGADIVVHSLAIADDNPEVVRARQLGIPLYTYPEFLGGLTKKYRTIGVSGTHGKTSTVGMLVACLSDFNPSYICGAKILQLGRESHCTDSPLFVIEADEFRGAFLHHTLDTLIILNIEHDHYDDYHTFSDYVDVFRRCAHALPKSGHLIADLRNPIIRDIVQGIQAEVIDYSRFHTPKSPIIGQQFCENLAAVLAGATILGVSEDVAVKRIQQFSGTARRSEYVGTTKNGALVYDDYAHHATAVSLLFDGFKEVYPDKKLIALFEPHQISRTVALQDAYSEAFKNATTLFLLSPTPVRESSNASFDLETFAESIRNKSGISVVLVKNYDEAYAQLLSFDRDDCVLLTVGATEVYQVSRRLLTDSTVS